MKAYLYDVINIKRELNQLASNHKNGSAIAGSYSLDDSLLQNDNSVNNSISNSDKKNVSENEFLKGGETAAAYFGEVNPTLSKRRAFKEETMDWTKVWSKKYSILKDYESVIDTRGYEGQLGSMIAELMREYDLGRQDAFLVLKDILYKEYLKGKDEKNV